MTIWMVYHNDTGPLQFFVNRQAANMDASDRNAAIEDDRSSYHVLEAQPGDLEGTPVEY